MAVSVSGWKPKDGVTRISGAQGSSDRRREIFTVLAAALSALAPFLEFLPIGFPLLGRRELLCVEARSMSELASAMII